jgi:putative tryptophan/tyrosine transport system substrate-binding protein
MKRREFIAWLGGVAVWPLSVYAQSSEGISRVGMLGPQLDFTLAGQIRRVVLAELQKLGFIEGKNLVLEYRRIDQGMEAAITGARELVADRSDVIFITGPELALKAALAVNAGIPIVIMAINFDPIARGYIKSLAHPGGNITGLYFREPELAAKELELLAEAFPDKKQVGILWDGQSADQFEVAAQIAAKMRLSVSSIKLETPPYDFDQAFRALANSNAQVVLVLSSPLFAPYDKKLAELAIQYRLPSMYTFKYYVEAGGLMS